jgi:hypothetical protein
MSRFRRDAITFEDYSCLTSLKPKKQALTGPIGLISNVLTHEHSTILLVGSYYSNLFRTLTCLKIKNFSVFFRSISLYFFVSTYRFYALSQPILYLFLSINT